MNVKALIEALEAYDDEAKVSLTFWNGEGTEVAPVLFVADNNNTPSIYAEEWDGPSPNTNRDSVNSIILFDAITRLQGLADRWNDTPEWHNPPFLDGRIHITTGGLRDIATACREVRLAYLAYPSGKVC